MHPFTRMRLRATRQSIAASSRCKFNSRAYRGVRGYCKYKVQGCTWCTTRGCCERYFPIGRMTLQLFSATDRLCEKGDVTFAARFVQPTFHVGSRIVAERELVPWRNAFLEKAVSPFVDLQRDSVQAEVSCFLHRQFRYERAVPLVVIHTDTFVRLCALTRSQRKLAGVTMHLEAIPSEKSGVLLPGPAFRELQVTAKGRAFRWIKVHVRL